MTPALTYKDRYEVGTVIKVTDFDATYTYRIVGYDADYYGPRYLVHRARDGVVKMKDGEVKVSKLHSDHIREWIKMYNQGEDEDFRVEITEPTEGVA